MPALSDTMNNGRLTKWLKQPGDKIKSGEAVAEVETDKAVMEVEAFHDGYLAGPLAKTDSEFPVGQTIGFIADTEKEAADIAASPPVASVNGAAQPSVKTQTPPPLAPVTAGAASEPVSSILAAATANRPQTGQLSPRARALARHASGIAAEAVQPPAPAIRKTAPLAQKPATTVQPPPDLDVGPAYRIERASSLREAVARSMIASAATPTFRVTALLPLNDMIAFAKKQKLSLTLLLARACANTIAEHPLFNAAYTPDGLARRDRIDIGVAVDSPEGLITPVLRDVSGHTMSELAGQWDVLKDKVKSRRLVPSDYRGATFYLSDLGVFPVVYSFDSIVPTGAAAILSIGASRPEGTFFTLGCDHRVVFGGDAARFLQTLAGWLSTPAKLIEKEKAK